MSKGCFERSATVRVSNSAGSPDCQALLVKVAILVGIAVIYATRVSCIESVRCARWRSPHCAGSNSKCRPAFFERLFARSLLYPLQAAFVRGLRKHRSRLFPAL